MLQLAAFLKKIAHIVQGLLFPLECFDCGKSLGYGATLAACPACFARLPLNRAPHCSRCGRTAPEEGCSCPPLAPAWQRFSFAATFTGSTRKLLYRFKIQRDPHAGLVIRRLLENHRSAHGFGGAFDAIVPVPPHRATRWTLDPSPARRLADEISRLTGTPVRSLVRPSKNMRKQTSLSRQERLLNVRGGFQADAKAARFASALLVDDVLTTGATAGECAAALRQAGVSRVEVFALARGEAS